MFHDTGDSDERQQEYQSISFKYKASDLGISHDQKDQDKEQHSPDHKKADIGTINKEIFIKTSNFFNNICFYMLKVY